jgi:glycosyltransferase involved in cell wall biosynthesis
MADSVLAILPAYNVARHLPELLPRLLKLRPQLEVLLVDDGSGDDGAEVARRLGVEVMRHPVNRGKGEALKTGFARVLQQGHPACLTLDADGQHLPEEIPRFLEAWKKGARVVVGNRMAENERMPWLRKRTNEVMSRIVSGLANQRIEDSQCGYRLIDSHVLADIQLESSRYDLESEILIKAGRLGYPVASVAISTVYHDEASSIHPLVDTIRFMRLLWRSRQWIKRPGRQPAGHS